MNELNESKFEPNWESLDSREMPKWFQKAKFGIFIHWGVYSVPAWRKINEKRFASYAEWYYASVYGEYENNDDNFHEKNYGESFEYRDFAKNFNAELFEPDDWAKLFKKAGAKYVVLTAKHHDGYCLWPTSNKHKKDWRVTDVGPNIDILGRLSNSVRKQGIKMGIYYSIIEWETNWSNRPESGYFVPQKDREKYGIDEKDYPREILIPQLKELVLNYKPSLIFSDGGEWDLSEAYSNTKEFLSWLYNNAPNKKDVVVNDRFCYEMPGKHGDYFSSEYQDVSYSNNNHPWEESRGIGKSYGFNRAEKLEDYHTSKELIHELIRVVSLGGNFLLNVGPTPDGRIPTIQQERLSDIGDWLGINGTSIFDTRPCSYLSHPKHKFTQKSNKIYCIMYKWPEETEVLNISTDIEIETIQLLGIEEKLNFEINQDSISIDTPLVHPNKLPCDFAYVFELTIK
ncbi:alpha-L-fucosidase [Mammaliicoccus lentus]|uniref:alpha-L-fucosidase n=1 Tax=Mammaliicoccus lentus TaxID=42858 RepID=UPI00214C8A75|nr:alpha-L-fucosidase [Mammaliicoccus lentus]MCR1871770.1 alpha-L-fucosidase [Mammaliicoccus lentus]